MEFYWLLGLFVQYGYLLVFVTLFLDNGGLPLPGELVLLAFGFLARTGHVNFGWGVVAATVGAMAGDTASYWLGRLGGQRVLRIYCGMTLGSGDCVSRAVAYYQRFGRITIILGRFVMGVRAFLMPLAGSARLPYAQFLLFDGIGAVLWSSFYLAAGYILGNHVEGFSQRFRSVQILLGSTLATLFLAYVAVKLWRLARYRGGRLDTTDREAR